MLDFLWTFTKALFEIMIVIIKSCIQLLPAVFELKKYLSYMTPKGLCALYLGVPVFVASAIVFIKKWCFAIAKRNFNAHTPRKLIIYYKNKYFVSLFLILCYHKKRKESEKKDEFYRFVRRSRWAF